MARCGHHSWELTPGVSDRLQVKAVRDRIYYGDLLPPVGSQQLSYARFMQLLTMKQVKRVTLMADGQIALVEVRGVERGCCCWGLGA